MTSTRIASRNASGDRLMHGNDFRVHRDVSTNTRISDVPTRGASAAPSGKALYRWMRSLDERSAANVLRWMQRNGRQPTVDEVAFASAVLGLPYLA